MRAAAQVRSLLPVVPRAAIVLGTGLGSLAGELRDARFLPYEDVDGCPCSTAIGHRGRFVGGWLGSTPVVAMDGRVHLYEGYATDEVTYPVQALLAAGSQRLILTNASGGLNPLLQTGDVVAVTDHLDLMGGRPCVRADQSSDQTHGRRSTSRPYCETLTERVLNVARRAGIACHGGVYLGVSGPCYETRAEYRLFRRLGADVVGMSTIREAQLAESQGVPVLALSTVTNVCQPDVPTATSGEEVITNAQAVARRVQAIIAGVLAEA